MQTKFNCLRLIQVQHPHFDLVLLLVVITHRNLFTISTAVDTFKSSQTPDGVFFYFNENKTTGKSSYLNGNSERRRRKEQCNWNNLSHLLFSCLGVFFSFFLPLFTSQMIARSFGGFELLNATDSRLYFLCWPQNKLIKFTRKT